MTFKPPQYRPPVVPTVATYIADRNPKWKVHRNMGQAKNAVNYGLRSRPRGGVIYVLENERWIYHSKVEGEGAEGAAMPSQCAECGGQIWEDDYLCDDCREAA